MRRAICVECKADLILVRKLTGLSRKEILHKGCKSEVIKAVDRKSEGAIGLIDEDPGASSPKRLRDYTVIQRFEREGIELRRKGNRLIVVLRPDLEGWVVKAAEERGIDLGRYGLPKDRRGLHEELSRRPNKLEGVLDELMSRRSRRLEILKKMLLEDPIAGG